MQESAATLPIVPTTTVTQVTSDNLSRGMIWWTYQPSIPYADVAITVEETKGTDLFQITGSLVLPRHALSVRVSKQMMNRSILKAVKALKKAISIPRLLGKCFISRIGPGELTISSSSYRDLDRKATPALDDVRLREMVEEMKIKVERMESTIASQRSIAVSPVNINCSIHGSGRSSFFRRRRCVCTF